MAETRTHEPSDRDELDRALRAALGDPVRPFQAGHFHQPASAASAPDTPPAAARPATLGSFTFRAAPPSDGTP